jgi:hypothetical protein
MSWQPLLVVEEAGVPGENHGQASGQLYHLPAASRMHPFCNFTKSGCHDIAEILLEVALSTKNLINLIHQA